MLGIIGLALGVGEGKTLMVPAGYHGRHYNYMATARLQRHFHLFSRAFFDKGVSDQCVWDTSERSISERCDAVDGVSREQGSQRYPPQRIQPQDRFGRLRSQI